MNNAEHKQDIEYILCLSQKDPHLAEYMEIFRETNALRIVIEDNGLVKQVNRAAEESTGNLIVAVSDDFVCPEWWDTLLLHSLQDKSDYIVKTQDGLQPWIITLPIMDRAYYNRIGHIYAPAYNHMYGDEELAEVGQILGRTITLPYYFRHNHYSTGINEKDEVNERNDSFMLIDKVTFAERKKRNFDVVLLSILIPAMPARKEMLDGLIVLLKAQIGNLPIEICINDFNETIGTKRNQLLAAAEGEYLCFIDDDDIVADDYIYLIVNALKRDHPDCCSLNGVITTDGQNAKIFTHSIKHTRYFEQDNVYYRPPNHLNVIKSEIAKCFKFPEINFGEDTDWAMQICNSGMLKKESTIEGILYYYKYITNK